MMILHTSSCYRHAVAVGSMDMQLRPVLWTYSCTRFYGHAVAPGTIDMQLRSVLWTCSWGRVLWTCQLQLHATRVEVVYLGQSQLGCLRCNLYKNKNVKIQVSLVVGLGKTCWMWKNPLRFGGMVVQLQFGVQPCNCKSLHFKGGATTTFFGIFVRKQEDNKTLIKK